MGDLNAVMVNHARFTGELANAFTLVATGVCGLLAFGGTSLVVNPLATLGITAIGLLVLGALRPLRNRSQSAARDLASTSRTLGQEVTEVELLHREIELFHVGRQTQRKVDDQSSAMTEALRRAVLPGLVSSTSLTRETAKSALVLFCW